MKTWFQNRRMKMKRDYWKSANERAQPAPLASTIAVPCNLSCLVNAQPVHRSCHFETGLLYLPHPESTYQQQTSNFSMHRMSSPGPLREHHRLSHFEPYTEVQLLRRRGSEGQHVSPPTEGFGHDFNDARHTCAYGTPNFVSTRDQENTPNVYLASSRRTYEELFSNGYNCLTKDKMLKNDGICKRSPIIIC